MLTVRVQQVSDAVKRVSDCMWQVVSTIVAVFSHAARDDGSGVRDFDRNVKSRR